MSGIDVYVVTCPFTQEGKDGENKCWRGMGRRLKVTKDRAARRKGSCDPFAMGVNHKARVKERLIHLFQDHIARGENKPMMRVTLAKCKIFYEYIRG